MLVSVQICLKYEMSRLHTSEIGGSTSSLMLNQERLGRHPRERSAGIVQQLQGLIARVLEGSDDLQVVDAVNLVGT